MPVIDYDAKCAGSEAYLALAGEMIAPASGGTTELKTRTNL
jgi:hypothetical protein